MTRIAQTFDGQFSPTELKEKHEATLASREAMRDQKSIARLLAMKAADNAQAAYNKSPTKKNYRAWQTAETRANNA